MKQQMKLIVGEKSEEAAVKCYKSQLERIDFMTPTELFSGFDTIKAISFSYDINFIDSIMDNFSYGEIILGADFLVQKDEKIANLMAEVYTNAYEAGQAIKSHKRLSDMLAAGDILFRTPAFVLDHRKIYLLKSDGGRTRVITSSANMTKRAWNGEQMEFYEYDDSAYCYEEYEKDFETIWNDSQDIPYSVISSKKSDDLVEGNAILKGVKDTGKTVVLQNTGENITCNDVKYVIDHDRIKEEYKTLLAGLNTKCKNGVFEIVPKVVEMIEHKKRSINLKIKVNKTTEAYPSLVIDFGNKEAKLNDEKLDLNPTKDEVCQDIDQFIKLFNNFDQFIGDTEKLKETHFKMINAIFSSPFVAKLRCAAKIKGIGTLSLPLFLMAASRTANCVKTFVVTAALKMMTGKSLTAYNAERFRKDDIRTVQVGCKGIPVFIDEIDNRYLANIVDLIKYPEKCEDSQLENQPMIIFATNDVTEPDEILRKRMVFLRFEGALPSDIDQSAYKGIGNAILKRLGTGLYREYLKRMIDAIADELNYMILSTQIPDSYYPDLLKISSDTLISVFTDFGYSIPRYMHPLSWYDDYSVNAKYISSDVIREIDHLYRTNRKAFTLTKDTVTIELGGDKKSKIKGASWANVLPSEMDAACSSNDQIVRLTVNRNELESRLGYKLGGIRNLMRK